MKGFPNLSLRYLKSISLPNLLSQFSLWLTNLKIIVLILKLGDYLRAFQCKSTALRVKRIKF